MSRDVSRYVVDGKRVPSVTEILSIAGVSDFSGISPEVLEIARARGSLVHEWCELLDLGHVSADETPPTEAEPYVAAYLSFLASGAFVAAEGGIEQVVVCAPYRYAGTLDRRGKLHGVPAILDLKCSALVPPTVGLQLAGYALALDGAHQRYSLQLRSDGTYRLSKHDDKNDVTDWLACVRVAHFKLRHNVATIGD